MAYNIADLEKEQGVRLEKPVTAENIPPVSETETGALDLPEVASGVPKSDAEKPKRQETSNLNKVGEVAPAPELVQDELLQEVENILGDKKIADLFNKLTPSEQQVFKTRGEALAADIRTAISQGSLKPFKTLEQIKSWLKLIPNVEASFLLQEAKIDLDRIQRLAEEFAHKGNNSV